MINFIRVNQSNVLLVLSSICIMILIFLLMTNYLSKEKKRALLFFVFFTACLLLSDRYVNVFRSSSTDLGFFMERLCKYLVFFNLLNVVYGFGEFLKCIYIENHPDKNIPKTFNIIKVIILIGHIFLFVSQFTNFYYSYDINNVYHREKFYFICYIFPLLSTILQYIVIFKELKHTKKYIFIPLVMYFALPFVGAIIQIFYAGLSLVNIVIGGVVIILYSVTIYDANIMLEEKKKTEADLKIANEIQQNEIPNKFPAFPNRKDFDLYAIMKPAKEVGGDFYDYFLLDDKHLAIVVADVSGKGVPAALNMFKTKLLIRGNGFNVGDPAKVLTLVNNEFFDGNKLDMFVTIWFGIINLSTGRLTFANAGHEDLIICSDENGFDTYKTKHGIPIGTLRSYKYENQTIKLSKGDKLFIYTDGVTDSLDDNEKRYGINSLIRVLNKGKNKDVKELVNSVKNDVITYSKEHKQYDDMTMLCFELINENDKKHIKLKEIFKADEKEINRVYDYFSDDIANIVGIDRLKKYYVVVDEIFSNIVKYGFDKKSVDNYIIIDLDIDLEKKNIKVTFKDNGKAFNPLEIKDPNVKLSANERNEGGLGIFIVKKMMDNVSYEYKDNNNILIIEKKYK